MRVGAALHRVRQVPGCLSAPIPGGIPRVQPRMAVPSFPIVRLFSYGSHEYRELLSYPLSIVVGMGSNRFAGCGDVSVSGPPTDVCELSDAELDDRLGALGRQRCRVEALLAEAAAEKRRRVGGRAAAAAMRERLGVSEPPTRQQMATPPTQRPTQTPATPADTNTTPTETRHPTPAQQPPHTTTQPHPANLI